EVREMHTVEPSHGVRSEFEVAWVGEGRQGGMANYRRINAPADEDHNHDGRNLHNAHGLAAGFVDALDVVPPEIGGAENGEEGGAETGVNVEAQMEIVHRFVDQANDVLAGRHPADRPGENVVEHQGRNAELGQGAAHSLFHHAIHATTDEHAAALYVNGANAVGEQHDAEDEPRRGLANVSLSFA